MCNNIGSYTIIYYNILKCTNYNILKCTIIYDNVIRYTIIYNDIVPISRTCRQWRFVQKAASHDRLPRWPHPETSVSQFSRSSNLRQLR